MVQKYTQKQTAMHTHLNPALLQDLVSVPSNDEAVTVLSQVSGTIVVGDLTHTLTSSGSCLHMAYICTLRHTHNIKRPAGV